MTVTNVDDTKISVLWAHKNRVQELTDLPHAVFIKEADSHRAEVRNAFLTHLIAKIYGEHAAPVSNAVMELHAKANERGYVYCGDAHVSLSMLDAEVDHLQSALPRRSQSIREMFRLS